MYFLLSCLLFFSIVGWIRTISMCSLIETASNCRESSSCGKHTQVSPRVWKLGMLQKLFSWLHVALIRLFCSEKFYFTERSIVETWENTLQF